MSRYFAAASFVSICLITTPLLRAQTSDKPDTTKPAAEAVHSHPAEIVLWPNGAPGSEGQDTPETIVWRGEADASFPIVSNIHKPSITPYLPAKDKATGAAVIVAPGGGHQFLSIDHEGYDVAKYFADHGVAAFVLKYRLGRAKDSPYKINEHPVADARRAMRLVRSRAAEWGIDPARVGMMGFSAGGEVVTQLILQGDKPPTDSTLNAAASDAIDAIPSRPDFQALIYPGQSKNVQVDAKSPPAFLCCSFDDRADISEGLANVYLQFKKAGVPAELHIYSTGGHGFGIRPRPLAETTWPDRFLEWMKDRGYLTKK
ncbi:MAG TPA: alpha/beta hydrolase [Pirellulales bacterium]|jgi:endo-1,4-beta-xylanase